MEKYVLKIDQQGNEITVRDVQEVLLEMLKDIDDLCQKHKIPYFLNGGSALGAVRHKGFIPWDDDADIAMMYEDYLKFLEIVKELPEVYVVHCFEFNEKYNVLIPAMKIRKKGTYIKEVNKLLENRISDCDGIFVDVFVYDYCSKSKLKDLPPRLFNQALMPLIILFENIAWNPKFLKKIFYRNAIAYGKRNKNSEYIGFSLTWTFKTPFHPFIFRKDDIYPVKYVAFEDIKLPIASKEHKYLCTAIAPSYMTPPKEENRKPKHIVDICLKGEKIE